MLGDQLFHALACRGGLILVEIHTLAAFIFPIKPARLHHGLKLRTVGIATLFLFLGCGGCLCSRFLCFCPCSSLFLEVAAASPWALPRLLAELESAR